MKYILLGLLTCYQRTLSPDHGPLRHAYPYGFCRFYPSCSEYCYQAVERYGLLRGIYAGMKRVAQCVPLTPPTYDPLVPRLSKRA